MATDDKYDRQVRLWGGHGQRKLAHSHIVMLGTSSMGSETLKNLVLPAVGRFTIVDDALVTKRDLGNDFLVDVESLGKPKALALTEKLTEMNPDVKGDHIVCSVEDAITTHADLLNSCQLIIACDVNQNQSMRLSDICSKNNTTLAVLRQYGMLGYLRVFKQEQTIIEKKSQLDPFKRDLRVANPWPELLEFANSFDFDNIEEHNHVHTPYAVILIQAANRWRASHDGVLPKTFQEKQAFRSEIMKPMNKYNGMNFDEAFAALMDLWQPEIPPHVNDQLQHEQVEKGKAPFWCYLAALKKFISEEQKLPVSGVVPDMVSTTEFYLKIQQIYIAKAAADRQKLFEHLQIVLKEKGIQDYKHDEAEWLLFCKSIKQFTFSHMRSITEEINTPEWSRCANDFWDPTSSVKWLVVMRAFENLVTQGNQPGADYVNQDNEYALMRTECDKITASIEQEPLEEKYLREILRFGNAKIHNVSAYMGGVTAQECIKLLINQYLPINHTFVFDGIHGRGSQFDL